MTWVIKSTERRDWYYKWQSGGWFIFNKSEERAVFSDRTLAVTILKQIRVTGVTAKLIRLRHKPIRLPRINHTPSKVWYGVYLPNCTTPEIPVAIFQYADWANEWVHRWEYYNQPSIRETTQIKEIAPG